MHQVGCLPLKSVQTGSDSKPRFNKMISYFINVCVAVMFLSVSSLSFAGNTSAYSKPFHKQGRGWYPSMYWSTGRNLGSYYLPNTDGDTFKEVENWDKEQDVLVYFYRPNSQWASEEIDAPSYYINDELIFNLRAGSYAYVVLPAGSYDFAVRKSLIPLLGFEAFDDKLMMAFDLNLQLEVGMDLDPGSVTYIRHSEVSLPAVRYSKLAEDDPMATADVQLVDKDVAMSELPKTRLLLSSFWSSTDAAKAEELLNGTMKEYGWFTVIWPWSNNFIFGFPIFYLPSDIYRQLRPREPLTLEQQLYLYADDTDAYLDEIASRRKMKRNWLAPWRKMSNPLTLNDELILDKLERNARAGHIKPAPVIRKIKPKRDYFGFIWEYFDIPEKPKTKDQLALESLVGDRKKSTMLIRETLN